MLFLLLLIFFIDSTFFLWHENIKDVVAWQFYIAIQTLLIVIPILIAVAYFTLAERKILGAIQRRKGPNVIGVYGLLQPLADGFKLFIKESVVPSVSNIIVFYLSPVLGFTVCLMGWAVIPFAKYSLLADIPLGILYLFAVSSTTVYSIIMSGWSSNSKYAFLGSLRSTAQMISYEVSVGFILITVVAGVGSFNLQDLIFAQKNIWFVIPFLPLFLIFFISSLAETNRHPFDLPEAEAELVSGYNVEYSAMSFALFSLNEYTNILLISALNVILFFGGWLQPFLFITYPLIGLVYPINISFIWFGIKIAFFVVLFVWLRAALPRYRYDQLMEIGWKFFLPFSLTYLICILCYIYTFSMLPF